MTEPMDRLMVDVSLMPILTQRLGSRIAANLLDDLAAGMVGADRRLMVALGSTGAIYEPRFRMDTDGGDAAAFAPSSLEYEACLGPGVRWTGRNLVVKGAIPETVVQALMGGPLHKVVDHPQLSRDLIVEDVFEEPSETYFVTSPASRPPITIGTALGSERARLTAMARRIRMIRRRMMLAVQWRTPLFVPSAIALGLFHLLFAASMTGVAFGSTDARVMLGTLTVVMTFVLGRIIVRSLIIDAGRENQMDAYYSRLARDTGRVLQSGDRDAMKTHFDGLGRILTG